MSDSLACDIVMLPEPELMAKTVAESERLSGDDTLFTLREDTCYPHATVYMMQLKRSDLDKATVLLENIARDTEILAGEAYRYDPSENFLFVDYRRTVAMEELQQKVVAAINPIRDGMRPKDQERMLQAAGPLRESLEKYGYRGVGELFRPHVSLTRFAAGHAVRMCGLPEISHFNGSFTKLGLFEMGGNGTCMRMLASYDLRA